MVKSYRLERSMDEPSDRIQSVSRALRVLEEVGHHPDGVNPKRVAQHCDLPLSTTYHLLRTLAYEGYLRRLASGDYTLGLRIADRFRDLIATLPRSGSVGDVLTELADVTSHSTYLAGFVDGQVTLLDVVEGPDSPHLEDLIPGFHEGAHATALGKALLSTLPDRLRHAHLDQHGLRPFTSQTITAVPELDAELASQAETGIFVEECQYRSGVSCVAVLVDGDEGPLALGLSAPAAHFPSRRRRLVARLRQAAADLLRGERDSSRTACRPGAVTA